MSMTELSLQIKKKMIKFLIVHMRKIHNRPTGWVDMKTFVLLSFVCKKNLWVELKRFGPTSISLDQQKQIIGISVII